MTGVVDFRKVGKVARIGINRPNKMNALNGEVRRALRSSFAETDVDDDVKVVVLEGLGERAFSSGADLDEAGTRTAFERRRGAIDDPANVVRRSQKPVIALIRGYCLGGGLELASACDIRVASRSSSFGYPEIKHGWLPAGGGGTQSLPRLVGMGQAMRLILTGESIDAQAAFELRLVEEIHPDDEVEQRTMELAERIASHRLRALILAKAALRMTEELPLRAGLDYERELSTITYFFEDRQEAFDAFREKRAPQLDD